MASEVKVLIACGSGIATSTVAQEKVKEILRDALAVTTLRTPVLFGQMGGSEEDEVSVSVVILMALSNADDHLSMLQNIVKSIQDGDVMKTIRNAAEPEEIVSLVRAMIPPDTEAA